MRNKCIRNDIKICVFLSALHFKMSLSKAKFQHTDQTLKEKIEILGKLDCGVKSVDLWKQFNLSQSTLSTWKKQRCKLMRWLMLERFSTQNITVNRSCCK